MCVVLECPFLSLVWTWLCLLGRGWSVCRHPSMRFVLARYTRPRRSQSRYRVAMCSRSSISTRLHLRTSCAHSWQSPAAGSLRTATAVIYSECIQLSSIPGIATRYTVHSPRRHCPHSFFAMSPLLVCTTPVCSSLQLSPLTYSLQSLEPNVCWTHRNAFACFILSESHTSSGTLSRS